jgi:hypothetical protein
LSGAATIAVMLRLRQTAGTGRWDGRGGREAGLEGQHAGMLAAGSNHGKGPGSLGFCDPGCDPGGWAAKDRFRPKYRRVVRIGGSPRHPP